MELLDVMERVRDRFDCVEDQYKAVKDAEMQYLASAGDPGRARNELKQVYRNNLREFEGNLTLEGGEPERSKMNTMRIKLLQRLIADPDGE